MPRVLAALLTIGAVSWALILFYVPLSGDQPPGLGSAAYSIGAIVCHQRPERSFHAGGVQVPVCARCTGLYVAGALGALAGWLGASAAPRRTRALIAVASVPTALTLAVEWSGLAAPGNLMRAGAALPLGAAAAWLFVRMLRAESGQAHAVQSAQL
jgi:uncharacterized membrane protein